MEPSTIGLLVFGYPVSVAVILRWVPVVREQRWPWFWWHQAAVAAIVAGWAIEGRTGAVVINATWWVVAAIWFLVAGRRGRAPGSG